MTEHVHHAEPGEICDGCGRRVPKKRADAKTGPPRGRVTISVPAGEEGVLDELMIEVAEKFAEAWPEDAASAREHGVYVLPVGERAWQFRVVAFALIAVLQVPGLEPTE